MQLSDSFSLALFFLSVLSVCSTTARETKVTVLGGGANFVGHPVDFKVQRRAERAHTAEKREETIFAFGKRSSERAAECFYGLNLQASFLRPRTYSRSLSLRLNHANLMMGGTLCFNKTQDKLSSPHTRCCSEDLPFVVSKNSGKISNFCCSNWIFKKMHLKSKFKLIFREFR
jgi:hypothetical protein